MDFSVSEGFYERSKQVRKEKRRQERSCGVTALFVRKL